MPDNKNNTDIPEILAMFSNLSRLNKTKKRLVGLSWNVALFKLYILEIQKKKKKL